MKFSFDSGGYRENLAGELREQRITDKEMARQTLEAKRVTLEYNVSEDVKRVQQKIRERREEQELKETGFTPNPEKIVTEEILLSGSNGIEHLLEVQTIDISEQIPDEVKLIYDIYRLGVLDRKLKHLSVGPDIFGEPLTREDKQLQARAMKGQSITYLLEWYLKAKGLDVELDGDSIYEKCIS